MRKPIRFSPVESAILALLGALMVLGFIQGRVAQSRAKLEADYAAGEAELQALRD